MKPIARSVRSLKAAPPGRRFFLPAALLLLSGPLSGQDSATIPHHLHDDPAGRPLLTLAMPSSPTATFRLSIATDRDDTHRGRIAVLLILDRLRTLDPLGAERHVATSEGRIVVTVTGAAADADRLARRMIDAVWLDGVTPNAFASASAQAEAQLSVPPAAATRIRSMLRDSILGHDGAAAATRPSLHDFMAWWRTRLQPSSSRVVYAGNPTRLDADMLRRTSPAGQAPPQHRAGTASDTPVEIDFTWRAIAYPADGVSAGALLTAVALLNERLRDEPWRAGGAEFWWMRGRKSVILIASSRETGADPGSLSRLDTVLENAVEVFDVADAREARDRVRRDVLLALRTTAGATGVYGEAWDRSEDPLAAHEMLRVLREMAPEEIRDVMRALAAERPIAVELTP